MSQYSFTKFEKRGARLVKTPELTIQAKGTLSMNVSAHHAIGEPVAVELLYDAENQVIGLRPCAPEDPDAYPIRPVGGSKNRAGKANSFLVAGTAFLKYFEIPFGEPTRREVEVVDGVLIVDLKKPGRIVSSNRRKTPKTASEDSASQSGADAPTAAEPEPSAVASAEVAQGEVTRTL